MANSLRSFEPKELEKPDPIKVSKSGVCFVRCINGYGHVKVGLYYTHRGRCIRWASTPSPIPIPPLSVPLSSSPAPAPSLAASPPPPLSHPLHPFPTLTPFTPPSCLPLSPYPAPYPSLNPSPFSASATPLKTTGVKIAVIRATGKNGCPVPVPWLGRERGQGGRGGRGMGEGRGIRRQIWVWDGRKQAAAAGVETRGRIHS